MEYCGECRVCDEPVDLKDMGACATCGNVFHWGQCGEWGPDGHECEECKIRRTGEEEE